MNSIAEEMIKQSQNMCFVNFLCASCKNYQGKLVCSQGVFIAFEGANLSGCRFYIKGQKCPKCGERF
jgi:hypothetical protein